MLVSKRLYLQLTRTTLIAVLMHLLYIETVSTMERESSLPQTMIAVVGDTRSGKSSLLNALLEHGHIFPTSGMLY